MSRAFDALRRLLGQVNLDDAAGVTGAVALSAGVAFVYPPAGLIALGLLLLAAAWLLAGDDA